MECQPIAHDVAGCGSGAVLTRIGEQERPKKAPVAGHRSDPNWCTGWSGPCQRRDSAPTASSGTPLIRGTR